LRETYPSYSRLSPPIFEGNAKVAVREVRCSSLLHRLNFRPGSDEYTINLYKGCAHGCVYCYAPSLIRDERSWGSYVDAKVNAPAVLEGELRRAEKNVVFVSSASDPYQPAEAKYGLTRRCLEVLLRHDFPVLVLTRSPLVMRDVDLLKRLRWARVGFSISSVSDPVYEPGVPSLEKRIAALRTLRSEGIKTWVSLAPIVPQLVLTKLGWLFRELAKARVSAISLGLLRFAGYEQSKAMFEERTGVEDANSLLAGGTQVREEARKLAERCGLDTSCACLEWTEKDEKELNAARDLDAFL
jgi:DNA repair photolyase